VALSLAYVVAIRRGAIADSDDVSPWFRSPGVRPVLFAGGVLVALLALQSPIDRGGDEFLFSLHMTQHLLLMMVAPPLVLLGICGVPPPPRGLYRRLRSVWWAITRPWPALIIFNAVMLIWHIPALYDTTLTTQPVHVLEHVSFMAVGVIFWWPIIDPIRGSTTITVTPLAKIAMLVVSGIPTTVLGLIFALAPTPFYLFYVVAPRLWGLTPLGDQQIGGVVMLGASNIIYFFVIAIIFMRMLSDPARDEEEAEQRLAGAVR
jgi:cytochrome c oxidase assembly factor CtaG